MLEVSRLSVDRDRPGVVSEIDLSCRSGDFVAVTGPSGAGKSTLLLCLAGLLPPSAGTIQIRGDTRTAAELVADPDVVLIAQDGRGLAPTLTAHENVLVPLLTAGMPAREAGSRAASALTQLGLEEFGGHLVDELSGGQQQRVCIAQALARRPRIVLADEPTSALDAANRERVIELLREHTRDGAVVLMSTNDDEAADRVDSAVELDEGRLSVGS